MLNIHYSDFWTDPSKQLKPKAWKELDLKALKNIVYQYTTQTLQELKSASVEPQFVQVGNELTNGFLWPEGHIDSLENMV